MIKFLVALFISINIFACDGLVFEQLVEYPIVINKKLKKERKWGEFPSSLNINSYEIFGVRVSSTVNIENYKFKVYFKSRGKTLSTIEVSNHSKKERNGKSLHFLSSEEGVSQLIQDSEKENLDMIELVLSNNDKNICKREIKIWPGD